MKHTFWYTVLAVAFVAALTLGLAVYAALEREQGRASRPAEVAQSGVEQSAAPEDYQYVLGVCDGMLAVYRKGSSEAEQLFDVRVRTLPPLDQQLLAQGIPVRDYAALVSLIEDYIS